MVPLLFDVILDSVTRGIQTTLAPRTLLYADVVLVDNTRDVLL